VGTIPWLVRTRQSLLPTLTTTVFSFGLCQQAQSTRYCRRILHGCRYQQVCEGYGYTSGNIVTYSVMDVIPWDYILGLRYSSEYSCCTLLFISCGPHLRCKPCPDEITITAINMRRWEGSVSSLKIIWRSMHNELYTLKFPWNILFWSCKRWVKLCLCCIDWNTRICAIFHF
jgi:hypothetical protein